MNDVLIGRQPIFDAKLEAQAYELAFRFGQVAGEPQLQPSVATARVMTDALTTFGLDRLVGTKLATFNVTRDFLLSDLPLPVAPARIVLEISCRVGADPALLASIERWHARGFGIAIDDVEWAEPRLEPLFARADWIKVECLGRKPDDIGREFDRLRVHGKKLLAEKLETRREFDHCLDLGFDLFQGYFLERPGDVRAKTVQPQHAALLRLVAALHDPACDAERVEAIVRQDVGLSYRILRCVNSASFGLSRRIESLHEAIVYLGVPTIRNLTCLLLLAQTGEQPRELLRAAMFRARLCELVAEATQRGQHAQCFTAGLLSLFDALLGEPLPKLLQDLPLSADLKTALLEHRGEAGVVLGAVLALERADWDPMLALGLAPDRIQQSWIDAVQWVTDLEQQLGATS